MLIRIQLFSNYVCVCVSYLNIEDIAQMQAGLCQGVLQSVATGDVR